MEYRQLQQNQQLAGAEESHPTSTYAFFFLSFFSVCQFFADVSGQYEEFEFGLLTFESAVDFCWCNFFYIVAMTKDRRNKEKGIKAEGRLLEIKW